MDNPDTHSTLGTRLRTKTNKTKYTAKKTNKDEQHISEQKPWG